MVKEMCLSLSRNRSMKLNEYYVCDLNGYVIEKINANTLINITQPDGSTRWTLKNIDGGEVSRTEQDDETFCHHSCWVDPDAEFVDKVREGAEKEFDFFMKHGYHMNERDKK